MFRVILLSMLLLVQVAYSQNADNSAVSYSNSTDYYQDNLDPVILIPDSELHCQSNNNCNKGICDMGLCQCYNGYLSVYIEANYNITQWNGTFCNYEQMYQIKAFLFELFLGFGIGHFYAGRNVHGAFKLIAFVLGIFFICLYLIMMKWINISRQNKECWILFTTCLFFWSAIGLAFWMVYDAINFGMNRYLDGNGIKLVPWGS